MPIQPIPTAPPGLPSVIAVSPEPFKALANKVKDFFNEHFGKITFAKSLAIGLPLCILGGHVGIAIGLFVIGVGVITLLVELSTDSTIPV